MKAKKKRTLTISSLLWLLAIALLLAACNQAAAPKNPAKSPPKLEAQNITTGGVSANSIVAGGDFTCAIKGDGALACWGDYPTPLPEGEFTQLSASAGDTICGLKSNGTAVCWGNSDIHYDSSSPTFIQVVAGNTFACGLKPDGSIDCWGDASGNKTNAPSGAFVQLSAGSTYTCGVKADRSLACWGTAPSTQAAIPSDLGPVWQVAVGDGVTCVIGVTGTLRCWGSISFTSSHTYTQVSAESGYVCALQTLGPVNCWEGSSNALADTPSGNFIAVSAGGFANRPNVPTPNGHHGCGIQPNGAVECWGNNYHGETSVPSGTAPVGFAKILPGLSVTCGLKSDGYLSCWKVAGGGAIPSVIPLVKQASHYSSNVCGIVSAYGGPAGLESSYPTVTYGQVWCWGIDGSRPTDPGTFASTTPTSTVFRAISAGYRAACGIKADGGLKCWTNGSGSTSVNNPPPGRYVEMDGNEGTACAINDSGIAVCWGSSITSPSSSRHFRHLSVGDFFACGILATGQVLCWGNNSVGQLNGIPSGTFKQVSAGRAHACGLRANGTVACWGDNSQGQLDDVPSGAFVQINAGEYNTCGVRPDGTVVCWGLGEGFSFSLDTSSDATVNTVYSADFTFDDGNGWAPYTLSLVGGSLPSGVTLNALPNGARWLGGTPTQAGTYTFTIKATDSHFVPFSAKRTFTLHVVTPDTTAPTASPTQSPAANTNGWNSSNVTVTWNWAGETGGSGIDPANCTIGSVSSGEGVLQLQATCSDKAGNQGSASYTVKVDKTLPTKPAASFNPASVFSNSSGDWYKNSVAVSYAGSSDAGSGVASYSSAQTFNTTGAHPYSGTATDKAGNVSAATTGTVNVDATPPSVTITCPSAPVLVGDGASASWTANDTGSGLATAASGSVTLDTTSTGQKTATTTAKDNVGLTASTSCAYSVVNPLPVTSSVSPTIIVVGSSSVTLTVPGSGFTNTSVVRWNGTDLTTNFISASQLTATVPASSLTTAATAEVTVFTPAPGGGTSNPQVVYVTSEPTSVTETQSANSTGGTATASTTAVKAEATGGDGTLVVAEYASNPAGAPSFSSNGDYFDVYLTHGSTFTGVTASLCNASPGTTAYWWNGGSWVAASDQSYDTASGCLIITVNSSTSPSISQLTGTPFGLAKAKQTITFNALANKTYGDDPFTVSASASSGLPVSFSASGVCTVSSSTVTITGAGSCTITASQAGNDGFDPADDVQQSFTIAKAQATVTLSGLSHTYDGSPKSATVSTSPSGLSTSVTYNGGAAPPVNAGSYAVTATVNDANYEGSASGTLTIAKADATINVSGYTGTYDGQAHGATGTATGVKGEDLSNLLSLGGSFTDVPGGTANWSFAGNGNYNAANGTAQITITKASQSISFTSAPPPSFSTGSTYTVSATGGGSGNPVTFSSGTPAVCTVSGDVVTAVAIGTCTVTANQIGNDNYNGAPSVSQSFGVIYAFAGFNSPIANLPTVNKVKAGRAVPMKFSLNGDFGLDILEGSPSSQQVACDNSAPMGDVEQTVTAGHSSLQYDADTDTYTYVWKTDKSWDSTCRQLNVTLNDGTTHIALFRFR